MLVMSGTKAAARALGSVHCRWWQRSAGGRPAGVGLRPRTNQHGTVLPGLVGQAPEGELKSSRVCLGAHAQLPLLVTGSYSMIKCLLMTNGCWPRVHGQTGAQRRRGRQLHLESVAAPRSWRSCCCCAVTTASAAAVL